MRKVGKNGEGYPDPTSSTAIWLAERMPEHTYRDYRILRSMAYRMGLKITGLKDIKTGRGWDL